jgi:thiamine pyrophosphokinase
MILGATGTRVDHVLANLGLLSLAKQQGVQITLMDNWNRITLVNSDTVLHCKEQFGTCVSFFPVDGTVEGLTLTGFKYPLQDHDLTVADSGLTVSNEIIEETARVTYRKGQLLMIQSRD